MDFVNKNLKLLILLLIIVSPLTTTAGNNCKHLEKKENGRCVPCPQCPAGSGLPQDCGYGHGTGLKCEPCELGKNFRSDLSYLKCQPCTNCTYYKRHFLYHCRAVVDAECGKCLPDYYVSNRQLNLYWPSICTHCAYSRSEEADCEEYREKTATQSPSVPLSVSIETPNLYITKRSPRDPYVYLTWILFVLLLVLVICIIIYCACRNKPYIRRLWDKPQPCRKAKKTNTGQKKQRNNSEPLLPQKDLQVQDTTVPEEVTEVDGDKIALITKISKKKTKVYHVQSASKVLRSISDPGPSTIGYLDSVPLPEVATGSNITPESFVIEMPPNVVHILCDDSLPPNKSVPFDDSNGPAVNNIYPTTATISYEDGSQSAMNNLVPNVTDLHYNNEGSGINNVTDRLNTVNNANNVTNIANGTSNYGNSYDHLLNMAVPLTPCNHTTMNNLNMIASCINGNLFPLDNCNNTNNLTNLNNSNIPSAINNMPLLEMLLPDQSEISNDQYSLDFDAFLNSDDSSNNHFNRSTVCSIDSEATTLLIRSTEQDEIPEIQRPSDEDIALPMESHPTDLNNIIETHPMNVNVNASTKPRWIMPQADDHTGVNRNHARDQATPSQADNPPETEPVVVSVTPPAAIHITINTNITNTGPVNSNTVSTALPQDQDLPSDVPKNETNLPQNENETNNLLSESSTNNRNEESSDLTIPKSVISSSSRPSTSCGTQHACLYKQFHYPIQESVNSG